MSGFGKKKQVDPKENPLFISRLEFSLLLLKLFDS